MKLLRVLAPPPEALASSGLVQLGFRRVNEGWVRGSWYGAVFGMDPRSWLTQVHLTPRAGGTELVVEVETRLQILTAGERAYWDSEVAAIEQVLLGESPLLPATQRQAELVRIENLAISALSVAGGLTVGMGILCLGGGGILALVAFVPSIVLTYLGLLGWIRWRPLTDEERPGV